MFTHKTDLKPSLERDWDRRGQNQAKIVKTDRGKN